MKANTRERELLNEVELDEPHFDEESTVLSARPVIPLEVVEKKERSGKRWAFAAVIVVALLIGAFSAALVYKLRDAEPSPVAQEGELDQPPARTLEAGVGGIATAEPSTPNQPVAEEAAEKVVAKAPVSTAREPVAVSRNARQNRADDDRDEQIADERELKKENRRAEKIERRRQRRAERQAQRNAEPRSDDLLRIREIFEGAPRP